MSEREEIEALKAENARLRNQLEQERKQHAEAVRHVVAVAKDAQGACVGYWENNK